MDRQLYSARALDKSTSKLELYPDDNLDYVKKIEIEGEYIDGKDSTEVWIFTRA